MAKVVLIRVPTMFTGGSLALTQTPPIGLAYVAGYLRQRGHGVLVIDSLGEAIEQVYGYGKKNFYINGFRVDQIIQAIPGDARFIGISFPFSHEWPLAKEVCYAIREHFPDSVLIAGGEHVTAMPEFCLSDCSALDYCVLGEGEETLDELVFSLENNGPVHQVLGIAYRGTSKEIVINQSRNRIPDIDSIPYPAWDLVPLESYLAGGYSFGVNLGRTIPLLATRGCPYECTFCSNARMWMRRWVARHPENVVLEMEDHTRRYHAENFDFYDLTLIVRKDWIKEFCRLLIAKQLNVTWQIPGGTRSEALDDETAALMHQAGCRNVSYAPESGSLAVLKSVKKGIDPGRMIASMKAAVAQGINIKANLIIGFPKETLADIFQTYRLILRMAAAGVHDISLWTFTAYPGTEIFMDLVCGRRIETFDEEYFLSLLSYSDLRRVVSWSEHFPAWQLKCLRLLGFIIFYGTSYLLRPVRLLKTVFNIALHKPRSRMEMIIEKAINRHHAGNVNVS